MYYYIDIIKTKSIGGADLNKKGLLIGLFLIVVVALIAAFALSNRSSDEPSIPEPSDDAVLEEDLDEDEEFEGNGIAFEEEDDGANIVKVDAKESDFYGTWEATSDMAIYLYGNFELTIMPNGKWKGNITEEEMNGKWRMEGQDMHVINEWIDVTLCFTQDGTLVMQRNDAEEDEDPAYINTVLTKK